MFYAWVQKSGSLDQFCFDKVAIVGYTINLVTLITGRAGVFRFNTNFSLALSWTRLAITSGENMYKPVRQALGQWVEFVQPISSQGFVPMSHKNIKKRLVLWYFQGVWKWNINLIWVQSEH